MELVIYFFVGAIFSIFSAFSGAFQASTLHWGRLLAGKLSKEDIDDPALKGSLMGKSIRDSGFQDALTTRAHKFRQNVSIIFFVVFFITGFFLFKWYVPFIALIGILILRTVFQQTLPKPNSEYFKNRIIKELTSQSNFFMQNKNSIKKEATDYFVQKISNYDRT